MKTLRLNSVRVLLFLLLTASAFPTNWYLSTSGAGTGSGSWANVINYNSFNWNNVNAGDVVYFDGGATASSKVYNISSIDISGTSGNYIRLTKDVADASHNGTVIMDEGNRTQGIVFDGDYVIVEYLSFRDNSGSTSNFEVVRCNGSNYIFQYNVFPYTVSKGLRIDDGINNKVLHNTFDTGVGSFGNSDGIFLTGGGGLEVAYNTMLMRNTVSGPHKDIIQTLGWQQTEATSEMTTSIHHNFFYSAGTGMIDNTILEINIVGGYWEIYNNLMVYYRTDAGRAIGIGYCDDPTWEDWDTYVKIYNNTIYCSGPSVYAADFGFIDSLEFKNNLVRVTPGINNQPFAVDYNMTGNVNKYVNFDYNQYVVTDQYDFIYERYNTDPDDCNAAPARSRAWSYWRNTYHQDAHSTISYTDAVLDFVGSGFPYTGTQIPSMTPADYALEGSSNGIDDGTTLPLVTDDYNGNARTGTYDIGAFEYGASPPSTQTKKVRVIIIQ